MSSLRTYQLQNSAILRIASEREHIDLAPPYQRQGGIWTLERRQLLIDSILNEYDIPKLYFHMLHSYYSDVPMVAGKKYAVIDGRQRLESVLSFLDDEFPLAEDFRYFADERVQAAGRTYSEIGSTYPRLKVIFDSFTLPITMVETDDLDLVEDMFSRLNEAAPLSSAEKRNAIGGPVAAAIRSIATHPFFAQRSLITNRRFQHREVAARLLFVEECLRANPPALIDTKRPYLDGMVERYRTKDPSHTEPLTNAVASTLDSMASVFKDGDPLLRSQAFVTPLYIVFRRCVAEGAPLPLRDELEAFNAVVRQNNEIAEKDLPAASFAFLEYTRLSQQGTNDAASIQTRANVIYKYLRGAFETEVDAINEARRKQFAELLSDPFGSVAGGSALSSSV
jgi:hypothetical protein